MHCVCAVVYEKGVGGESRNCIKFIQTKFNEKRFKCSTKYSNI